MAGSLAETELKLRLYHGPARFDLIVKDYQGEHVTLGSEEPIQEFFADCDAVFLCLDPEGSTDPAERRRRQQEVENLLERYIDRSEDLSMGRPVALLLTKFDRVLASTGTAREAAGRRCGLSAGVCRAAGRRAVRDDAACPGGARPRRGDLRGELVRPRAPSATGRRPSCSRLGLEGPLGWVAEQLEARDRAEMNRLWELAPDDLPRLERCVAAYEAALSAVEPVVRVPRPAEEDWYGSGRLAPGDSLVRPRSLSRWPRWPDRISWPFSAQSSFERAGDSPRPRSRGGGRSCSNGIRRYRCSGRPRPGGPTEKGPSGRSRRPACKSPTGPRRPTCTPGSDSSRTRRHN